MKEYKFKIGGKEYNVTVNPKEGKLYDVTVNGATYEVEAENAPAAAPVPRALPHPSRPLRQLPPPLRPSPPVPAKRLHPRVRASSSRCPGRKARP